MGSVFPSPVFQPVDGSGVPYPGGKLYTYESGTTTNKTTWQDADYTAAHPNPIVLDAAGRATIYLGTGNYRFVLHDSTDTPVSGYDIDPVSINGGGNGKLIWLSDFVSLSAALTAAGSTDTRLMIDRSETISASATVPLNVQLDWINGAVITDTAGETLTIKGPMDESAITRFGGTLNVVFGPRSVSVIRPEWWNGTGINATDVNDEPAIQKALTCRNSSLVGSAVVVNYRSAPVVWLGSGRWLVDTSGLTGYHYTAVNSNGASLESPTDSVVLLSSVGYGSYIGNTKFIGGTKGIVISTNNLNSSLILIDECEFQSQTVAQFETDNNSASSLIRIRGGKMELSGTSKSVIALNMQSGNKVVLDGVWLENACDASVVVGSSVTLEMNSGGMQVPIGANPTGCWFKNYGSVIADGARLSSESSGRTILENHATLSYPQMTNPKTVSFKNGWLYAAGLFAFKFLDLPNVFACRNNVGFQNTLGLYIDPSIPAGSVAEIGKRVVWDIDENVLNNAKALYSGNGVVQSQLVRAKQVVPRSTDLRVSEVAQVVPVTWSSVPDGPYTSPVTGVTAADAADSRGMLWRTVTGTSASDDGIYGRGWDTLMNGYSAGWYTASYTFEGKTQHTSVAQLYAPGKLINEDIPVGRKIVNVPFYFDGGSDERVGLQFFGVQNGAQVAFSNIRILEGVHLDVGERLIMVGSAAPGSGGQYEVGDMVLREVPTAGGSLGDICTTAGSPGTWTALGNSKLKGSTTWDPPNILTLTPATQNVTVTGAVVGDHVDVSFSNALSGLILSGEVSAANTVTATLFNPTAGAIDLASGTLYAETWKP